MRREKEVGGGESGAIIVTGLERRTINAESDEYESLSS
jgi:hypothetical protein